MVKKFKRVFILLLVLASCLIFACSKNKAIELKDCSVKQELEFGGINIQISIDDFNQLGFKYGDSVNVSFSNGYYVEDIPYYSGYYTKTGQMLLVAYPGYKTIRLCINNGDDLFLIANLTEDDLASVSLNSEGKYLDIQNARDIHYYDERTKYDSDAMFANYRSVKVSGLKDDTLFRSASPCDNQHNRAKYVDDLCKEDNIAFILNLADTETKINGYINKEDFNSDYFLSLYNNGLVYLVGLNMNYSSLDFKQKLVSGLKELIKHEGPYLIHCTEGKDRTGFVCVLLEALVGASYEEIENDYMITYYNYYRIDSQSDEGKYNIIVNDLLKPMIEAILTDDVGYQEVSLSSRAASYLISGGMSEDEVALLKERLTN